jgi:hypothetical protein
MSVCTSHAPFWGVLLFACLSLGCGEVHFNQLPDSDRPAGPGIPSEAADIPQVPDETLQGSLDGPMFVDVGTGPAAPHEDPTTLRLDELLVATVPTDLPDYVRKDWPHWGDSDKDCQNTRAEVLIIESYEAVSFKSATPCTVATGEWFDPYTEEIVYAASDLDVDHMIPLKNTHISGGHAWTKEKRRAFANDMNHPEHLIAVTASANRSKGARGPEAWKPPAENHWCDYATHWIDIKWRWELSVTPEEYEALADMLTSC